ncbi:MAG: hypothetical protein LBC07_06485 [Elusimicrobiota bacterium]|jgi:uncharacterized membrane protein YadS|nr:hypothetical protein [Elusimicrobiota bacterium]
MMINMARWMYFVGENFEIFAGAFLIAINMPLGWVGLGYFLKKASRTKRKICYFFGILIYIFSWVVLAFGVFLCGKELALRIIAHYRWYIIFVTILVLAIVFIIKRILKKKIENKT